MTTANTMTCICGTVHTFAEGEFMGDCAKCGLVLWRTGETVERFEIDPLYASGRPVVSSLAQIEKTTARIAASREENDDEAADRREARLFAAVLRAIAEGATNPAELARAALGNG